MYMEFDCSCLDEIPVTQYVYLLAYTLIWSYKFNQCSNSFTLTFTLKASVSLIEYFRNNLPRR